MEDRGAIIDLSHRFRDPSGATTPRGTARLCLKSLTSRQGIPPAHPVRHAHRVAPPTSCPCPALAGHALVALILPTWPGILYLRPRTRAAVHIWRLRPKILTQSLGERSSGGSPGTSHRHPLPPQDRSRYFPPRRLVPNPTVAVSHQPARRQTVSGPVLFAAPLRDSAPFTPTPVSTTQHSTLRSWEGSYGEFAATQAPLSAASASPSLSRYSRPSCPRTVHSQVSPTATGSACRRHMLLHTSERSDRGSLPTVRATSTPLSIAPAQMSETVAITRASTRSCVSRRQNRTPTGRASISSSPRLRPNALVDPLALLRHHLRFNPGERNSPLFARAGSYPSAFQKSWFVETLRRSITAAGIEAKHFSGHSFRRGLATWAKLSAKSGDDDIRLLGR